MSSYSWLNDYYSVILDVISPACGLSIAVSSAVLISMYGDVSDTVTVRVSGMLGLTDAFYQITQLIIRELSHHPKYSSKDTATARVFVFLPYFLQLLNTLMVSRIAIDLETNFLQWFGYRRARWKQLIATHYVKVSVIVALLLACPLFGAHARFNSKLMYPNWTFGSRNRDILYLSLGFYLWVGLQLLNFLLVMFCVIYKLRHPQQPSPASLSSTVMQTAEQKMRRNARILLLYPLSPLVFFAPWLIFYWTQTVKATGVATTVWAVAQVISPLQSMYDMLVFAMLPPVQRVISWHCVLHKDSDMLPLYESRRRSSLFIG